MEPSRPMIATTLMLGLLCAGLSSGCSGARHDRDTAYTDRERDTTDDGEMDRRGPAPHSPEGRWAPHPSGIGPGLGR